MISQGVVQQRLFLCCFGLHIISSLLAGSTSADGQNLASNIKAAQSRKSENPLLSPESTHPTNEIVKPSPIRNRRSNLFPGNEHLYDNNADLDSAFLYNDQIMQNLLSSPSSKPLSYTRSNFFLNYLKPRTTRYNAWDDHSLMHFGKRSLENDIDNNKVLVKRSADFWSPNNVLHFGKKSEKLPKGSESPENAFDMEIDDFDLDESAKTKDSAVSTSDDEKEYSEKDDTKKSVDPWHSMMSFGKKSQNPWDHNTMHFGKKNEVNDELSSNKRSENFWDHNTMHFGKRDEPWHNMMSFGKKSDPWHSMMSFGKKSDNSWDHNTLHFGKRDEPWHNMMSFGKRDEPWHSMMSFGKRDEPWHSMMSFGKRDEPWHNMMSFGKREEPWHNMMSFGKRDEPWHNMMSFGKRDEPWHNMMSFGKRNEPWHNMMSFGKRDEPWHNMMSFGKRDPWDHNTLHFGKRTPWDHDTLHFGKRDPWDHNTLHFGKRDDPWHNMMSFGKKSDNLWDHNTLHFGKKDEPWHSMMSFGKKSENSDMTDLEKREDPWHNMMSFGKKSDGLLNNSITMVDKREEPWHSMMSFGKKADYGFDHSNLHFGKRQEPWHSMMSFGKKSVNPWDHNTLHFGKKDEPWHNIMSVGEKLDPLAEKVNLILEREDYPPNNMMNIENKRDRTIDDLSEDFSSIPDPWYDYDGMMFYKKSNPWDHNTLHFGKKSNATWESASTTENVNANHIQKRSTDMWNDHHTMHFGKKFDPWENYNTMHFGKKSDSIETHNEKDFENKEDYDSFNEVGKVDKKFDWDSHNTMHFGKRDPEDVRSTFVFDKRNPWDYHNTMHFGKRDPWDYHNTMHFGKRDPWDYHNTMHFGKRYPWDYHNTMHFGKRDPWDYHNTMHFGKRNPWDYHNTMHFGKRSNSDLEDGSISTTVDSVDKKEIKSSNLENMKDISDSNGKIKVNLNNNEQIKENFDPASYSTKFLPQSEPIKQPVENLKSSISTKNDGENMKPSITENSSTMDNSNIEQASETKSRIKKRSINPDSFMKSINEDSNTNIDLNGKYSRNDIADSVLHFGKRSIEIPDNDNEEELFGGENEKRFDEFWNDHNTLHFGKKSDFWDNHNTLHFGKKSIPEDTYSVMPTTKRDPWEHLNTLHFGKKFDPWEGHAKLHFGKRTDSWDHNVMHFGKRFDPWDGHAKMHFGKRDDFTPDEFEILSSVEDFDPVKLKDYIQYLNTEQDDSAENSNFLENLAILKSIINSRLKDDNIPFEERVNLLKRYLKPILKAIIDAEGLEYIPISEPNDEVNERFKDFNKDAEDTLGESRIIPFRDLNKIKYDEAMLKKGNDDSSYGEYGDNSNKASYSTESENLIKSKRKYLGKAELKRYFVPFQGPKSIVYPHAWFASQIRRSSLPRTTDYARHMEMRMAEKKEDPFNSYMHFGRR